MSRKYPILPSQELQDFLVKADWQTDNGQLFRVFSFSSYIDAADFVQKLASLAEEENHHPDILLSWRKVSVWLVTHDSGGITPLDTKFANHTNHFFSLINDDS